MELAETLQILWRRKLALAVVVLIAAGAAVGVKLGTRSTPTGAATVQVLVDSPSSALANLLQEPAALSSRAAVLAQVMASETVLQHIGAAAGVPPSEITAQGPYSGAGQALNVITPSAPRANQLLNEGTPYRLTFVPQLNEPVITATVQAPTALGAGRVAAAVYPGVRGYLDELQRQTRTPAGQRVTLRELGAPQVATVNGGAGTAASAAAGLGVLILGILLIVVVEGQRRRRRELIAFEHGPIGGGGNGHSRQLEPSALEGQGSAPALTHPDTGRR